MRIGSTSARPSQQRVTARTILPRSTASFAPERFVTSIETGPACGAVRRKPDCAADATADWAGLAGGTATSGIDMALLLRERWHPREERHGVARTETTSAPCRPSLPRAKEDLRTM